MTQHEVDLLKARERELWAQCDKAEMAANKIRSQWCNAHLELQKAMDAMKIEAEIERRMAEKGVAK